VAASDQDLLPRLEFGLLNGVVAIGDLHRSFDERDLDHAVVVADVKARPDVLNHRAPGRYSEGVLGIMDDFEEGLTAQERHLTRRPLETHSDPRACIKMNPRSVS
jgi:hypothetical protein